MGILNFFGQEFFRTFSLAMNNGIFTHVERAFIDAFQVILFSQQLKNPKVFPITVANNNLAEVFLIWQSNNSCQ